MNCLRYFCCRCLNNNNNNILVRDLNIEEIHQYVSFEDIKEARAINVYWEAVRLKQKFHGRCREKKQ